MHEPAISFIRPKPDAERPRPNCLIRFSALRLVPSMPSWVMTAAAIRVVTRSTFESPVSTIVALCKPVDPIREVSAMPEVAIRKDRHSLTMENEIWASGKLYAICGERKP